MDFAGAELEVSAGLLGEVAAAAGSDVVLLSAFDADEDHPGCSIHVFFSNMIQHFLPGSNSGPT